MKHCGRDKFSSEITPAPPQDFLGKEKERKAKIQLHTSPPVKRFLLSSLYTDKCSSLCYLNSTYQTTSLPPQATPTTKKAPLSPHLLPPPWGRIGFLQLVPLFEEKRLPLSRSHTIMHYSDYTTYFKYQEHCKPHQNTQTRT